MSQNPPGALVSAPGGDPEPASTSGLPPGADDILRYVPTKFKLAYKRAVLGQLSTRRAVTVQCRQCMGWTQEACDNRSCPLWMVSPWGRRKRGVVKGQDDHQDEP